eukprot:gnl/TRDRNA2_/TRDRNA2_177267_c6_seq2.p2 gnl/TRDRNA2_/TRDRNA2_177267_c6~~gnl/TRDRNA2_/TRDRNA2_177267_c6_seq2.p2  ORF type:complete len:110 (+),score=18.90 gnl/TRDRNA2_/TRDRNA2_177267_c6_seq2:582-911(+)
MRSRRSPPFEKIAPAAVHDAGGHEGFAALVSIGGHRKNLLSRDKLACYPPAISDIPPAISDIPSLVAPSVGGSASWILLKSSAGNVAKAALTSSTLAPLTTAARPEELR